MSDEGQNPIKDLLPDVGDVVSEIVTLSKEPKNLIAKKTFSAYGQTCLAVGVTVPLLAGGPPTISQQVVRKPEEHVTAQSQNTTVNNEGESQWVVSATTSDIDTSDGSIFIKRI
jgi:hypothetical protein